MVNLGDHRMEEQSRFASLGKLEDLPQRYRDDLEAQNLVPLWPSLRAMLPPHIPAAKTATTHWSYKEVRKLLIEAGKLTPIEKAERRVLVLANPGHGLEKMQASPAMYAGMQLLLPGEIAPAHRHTPNAIRMVVEGEGAWTLVGGEKCMMRRGDLILTPTGMWHEHGHEGNDPVIWLDVLDLPLVYYMETSYHIEGPHQKAIPGQGAKRYARGGLVPTKVFQRTDDAYPLLCYPWSETKAALLSIAEDESVDALTRITYVNPETGRDAQNILGFYALMLKPGQTVQLPAQSPAQIFHQIEGKVRLSIAQNTFALEEADTAAVPGYSTVELQNLSASAPAFLFMADEAPLHRKLGLYEIR
jgi:gentisate 1,2-dioxygenase